MICVRLVLCGSSVYAQKKSLCSLSDAEAEETCSWPVASLCSFVCCFAVTAVVVAIDVDMVAEAYSEGKTGEMIGKTIQI